MGHGPDQARHKAANDDARPAPGTHPEHTRAIQLAGILDERVGWRTAAAPPVMSPPCHPDGSTDSHREKAVGSGSRNGLRYPRWRTMRPAIADRTANTPPPEWVHRLW